MPENQNKEFELRSINHLALVCKDMARTVDFYSNVLGMPLIKTIDLPNGMGQHFFFDMGNGGSLAFFWFPDAPEAVPGVASPQPKWGAAWRASIRTGSCWSLLRGRASSPRKTSTTNPLERCSGVHPD